MSVGVYTGMEDVTFKHHFRNISIRIVVRDHHLKSEHEDNQYSVTMRNMREKNVICGVQDLLIDIINEPEDALLVRALSDEENTEPEERGVG